MGYLKIFADKDTFIQDRPINTSVAKQGPSANFGASETLEISRRIDPGIFEESFVRRALTHFNISALSAAVDSNLINMADASTSATLKLFNVNHGERQAEGFYLHAYPVINNWTEGSGTEPETSPISGYADWYNRSVGNAWNDNGLGLSGTSTSNDVDVTTSATSVEFI